MDSNISKKKLALVITLALIALGYFPLVWMHLALLWRQPHYQYFPFVITAVAWLLWSRWNSQVDVGTSDLSRGWTIAGGLVCWSLLAIATLLYSPWLAMLSLILLFGVGLWHVTRQQQIVNAFGIWVITWLLLPIPLGLDRKLVQLLQAFSSRLSSHILDTIGFLHLMDGNVLKTVDKQFFVDEACSGIISTMSVIACATIYSVWKNRPVFHFLFNVLLAPIWAMLLNAGRISIIAVVFSWWQIDLSSGWQHETLGLMLFLLTFGALICTDNLLAVALAPIDASKLGYQPTSFVRWFNNFACWRTPDATISAVVPRTNGHDE